MDFSELKGLFLNLYGKYWWAFLVGGAIIAIIAARELYFYLYFNYYLHGKEQKLIPKRQTYLPEKPENPDIDYIVGKIKEDASSKSKSPDSIPMAEKQKQIREKIGSIVASEDIHKLLTKIEKKERESQPELPKEIAVLKDFKKQEKEPDEEKLERREEKPEEVRRLGMRKARLVLTIKRLDEDYTAGKISQDNYGKKRKEAISELADTEEALIDFELKKGAKEKP